MLIRAQEIADTLVALRRQVHRHPELGFQEHHTAPTRKAQLLRETGRNRSADCPPDHAAASRASSTTWGTGSTKNRSVE